MSENEYDRIVRKVCNDKLTEEKINMPSLYYNPMEDITVGDMKRKQDALLELAHETDLSEYKKVDENIQNMQSYLSDEEN